MYSEILVKIRHDDVIYVTWHYSHIYSHVMTSSTKMLTSAEKTRYWTNIKASLRSQDQKIKKWQRGSNGPPSPCGASRKAAPCLKIRISSDLMLSIPLTISINWFIQVSFLLAVMCTQVIVEICKCDFFETSYHV